MSVIGLIDMDFFECQVWSHIYPELAESPHLLIYESSSSTLSASTFTLTSTDPAVCLKRPVDLQTVLTYSNVKSDDIKCFAVPLDPSTGKSQSPEAKKKAMLEIEGSLRSYMKLEFGDFQDALSFSKNDDDIVVDLGKLIARFSRQSKYSLSASNNVNWIGGKETASLQDKAAAEIMGRLLTHLRRDVRFQASGGIGPSLIVAKLARELNKPGGVTVVPSNQVDLLYSQIDLKSAPELKGKCGRIISEEIRVPGSEDKFLTTLLDLRQLIESFQNAREMHQSLFKKYPSRLLGLEKCHRLWHLAKGTDCGKCCEILSHPKHSHKKSCAVYITASEASRKSVQEIITIGTLRLLHSIGTENATTQDFQRYLKFVNADLLIVQSFSSECTKRVCFSVRVDAGEIEGDNSALLISILSQRLSDKLSACEKSLLPHRTQYYIEKLTMLAKFLRSFIKVSIIYNVSLT